MEEHKYECIWSPQPDIAVYELAQCIPYIFSKLHSIDEWDKLDESITRHFKITVYNYGEMIRETRGKLEEVFNKFEEMMEEDEDE
jgi:hypothetical protein